MKEKHHFSGNNEIGSEVFLIKKIKGISVGVILVNEKIKCYLDVCPHAGAPVCQGSVSNVIIGERRDERKVANESILRCPWHGWEFRLEDGQSFIQGLGKLISVQTEVIDGEVYVFL